MLNNFYKLIPFILINISLIFNTIIVIPFKINTYSPKIEGIPNVTDLINQYLIHDMYSTIEIGSGSSVQKVTAIISPEESILSLSSNICKRKSLDTINDLSIVSKVGLDISKYDSDIINKNYTNYLDNENKIGTISDSIFLYNTLYLSSQPIEKNDQFEQDTKIKIDYVAIPIKDKNDNKNEKLCAILGIGSPLKKLEYFRNFIDFFNSYDITDSYSWTLKFHTRTEGRLIIGDEPHNYESNTKLYNYKKFKKRVSYSPVDKELPWSFHFKEISFLNSKNEKINIGQWIKMILVPNIGFIISEDKYKNLILKYYFQELIDKKVCVLEKTNITKYSRNEISFGTSGIYEIFHCDKSLNKEKKVFPKLNFIDLELDYIFSFGFYDLFELIDERYYFLVIFPEDITHAAYKVWYLGLPFYYSNRFVFNYDSNTIGIYDQNIIIDDKNSSKKEDNKEKNKIFSGVWRIVIEVIIGIILVVIAFFIGKKINEKRKKRANELNDDNYEYTENNINDTEDKLIQNNKNPELGI